MKTEELRIGNWIKFINDDTFRQIRNISTNHVMTIGDERFGIMDGIHLYEPIALTEEWLTKFGFFKDGHYKRLGNVMLSPSFVNLQKVFTVTLQSRHDRYEGNVRVETEFNHMIIRYGVESVHQLQNLYFALTQEELTIK